MNCGYLEIKKGLCEGERGGGGRFNIQSLLKGLAGEGVTPTYRWGSGCGGGGDGGGY